VYAVYTKRRKNGMPKLALEYKILGKGILNAERKDGGSNLGILESSGTLLKLILKNNL
jgi:hypothetical protein